MHWLNDLIHSLIASAIDAAMRMSYEEIAEASLGFAIGILSTVGLSAYLDHRKRCNARREFLALKDEMRHRKPLTMDVSVEICRRLTEIEASYGEAFTANVLVTDSQGIPRRLALTSNGADPK